ncbi:MULTISPECIES: DUF1566 domain-containing protein [unclassified Lentimonas]|uniref:Lcl domain-containing protein n=1 Tax=unclassified Lentimonas TaxID=2630993 RepID=UPI001325D437|nr:MULTISPECIES: DUF1566 domain-containing protein [unclassified Lentimonas]CAA6676462.1 putative PQQ enzyme repeat [Lentimonas sp. CC4]CAA6685302.1 putative PQQ enzyme repeat [Lentimonas sp. CC6]CAA7074974.1 putative PQQ enzyme repeat [Lentimonas sp. CC4]CAA7171020.1 putative PQQ enzyme repeat [Lentimonas sp. CC21]CAA7180616.1 putative PQQ enzyme repeat [Lentimonas sp. CC8]
MKKALALILILAAGNLFAQTIVTEVSPDQADPGTTGLTVTFTLPDSTPPTPPVGQTPTSVTIGTISGTSITRVSFDTVTAVFDIPADETEGSKDVAVIFSGPTLTKTAGFTVGDAPAEDDSYPNGPPSSGYNLLSTLNSKSTYLMDNDENIVNTWTSSYNPGNAVYLLEDGTLMRTANTGSTDFDTGGTGGRVEQYDWEGNLIWEYDYDTSTHRQHHDVEVLPNGNILIIAWELKTQVEAVAAGRDPSLISEGELWPDSIIEVAPIGSTGGTIVWEWHAWDHLVQDYDASADNYGTVADHPEKIDLNYTLNGIADWHHINSIDYNAELDQILLSVHNFSEIWIIDHNTTTAEAAGSAGDLLYRWGNPAAYDSGDADDQQLFLQHDAKWIEAHLPGAGNILIFNNGQGRSDGDYSSVDEITPPVAADGSYTAGLPLAPTWSYTNAVPTDFYGANISGAQRLPNGNTLICEGPEKYAFEVTSAGDLVWDTTSSGSMFRFERYTPDFTGFESTELALPTTAYTIVDTGQDGFYNDSAEITEPGIGDEFYGQDATHGGNQPKYEISADGLTVYDYNTGLTWTRSHDINDDGLLNYDDKLSQSDSVAYAATINASTYGGYSDWRLPSIKELYSLMDFRGKDPSPTATDATDLYPFIDTNYFEIGPGDLDAGDRIIDGQFATTTIYVDQVMGNQEAVFGLNLIDGRIKGYPTQTGKLYYVYYCRGNPAYGTNNFADNGDGTVTDHATGLMWAQADDGSGMDWSDALSYAEASELAEHSDWRLPNTKELQSLLDYTRSPSTTASAAIDPVFSATQITNMAGDADYPWYWTGTTHLTYTDDASAGSYVCFGRGTGTMDEGVTIIDVHGAGCQRSDPKTGDAADYPSSGHGPQGDVQRVFNHVRLVRTVQAPVDSVGDGISDAWRSEHFGGDGTTTDSDSEASADPDGDNCDNWCEYMADTDPNDPDSRFTAEGVVDETTFTVFFDSSAERIYTLWRSTDLGEESWETVTDQIDIFGSGGLDNLVDSSAPADRCFYRIGVALP